MFFNFLHIYIYIYIYALHINLALDLISTSNSKKFIIHSDSISVLQSLKYTKLENPQIVKLFNKLNSLIHSKKVIFWWIPCHIGIQGNDNADSLAKAAINMTPDKNIKTPYTDLKPKIKEIVTKKWQQLWDENSHNNFFQIQPNLKEMKQIIPEEKKLPLLDYALDTLNWLTSSKT